jgi:hypothetical protein
VHLLRQVSRQTVQQAALPWFFLANGYSLLVILAVALAIIFNSVLNLNGRVDCVTKFWNKDLAQQGLSDPSRYTNSSQSIIHHLLSSTNPLAADQAICQ